MADTDEVVEEEVQWVAHSLTLSCNNYLKTNPGSIDVFIIIIIT